MSALMLHLNILSNLVLKVYPKTELSIKITSTFLTSSLSIIQPHTEVSLAEKFPTHTTNRASKMSDTLMDIDSMLQQHMAMISTASPQVFRKTTNLNKNWH